MCESGVARAESVFGKVNVKLVDVDLDFDLLEQYTNRVPVIETLDGIVIDEGIVTEATLRGFNSRR